MSLCILGDFRIMKWKPGNTLPKGVYRAKITGIITDPYGSGGSLEIDNH